MVNSQSEWLVILFALAYPSFLTWVYFTLLANARERIQQFAYGVGKAIQFLLPVVWTAFALHESLSWPTLTSSGLYVGIAFGSTVAILMVSAYLLWLKPKGIFSHAGEAVNKRLLAIGVRRPAIYIAVALFYSLTHSLLEEYYWRWFVFGQLRLQIPLMAAIVISSIAFMGHHVIVLGTYVGWRNPWTHLFSIATAVGGAFWAWLYWRSGSIYGPWFSHLLLDAAIFGVGYDLMRTAALPHA